MKSQFHSNSTEPAIPARVVIGVTGHRKLENQLVLTKAIRSAIQSINEMMPPMRRTPVGLCVLSPLAEGADRLVVKEVLKVPGATLEVIIPLPKDNYIQDFKTSQSKKEFEKLLSQASSIKTLSTKAERKTAFEQVGHYVVDQCDVLIALWNGKAAAGHAGTEEIVQYARETGSPLVWIHSDEPAKVTIELGRGLNPRPFHDLDEFNSERVGATEYENQLQKQLNFFVGKAKQAELPNTMLQETLKYTQSNYVRADVLALRYQHLYYGAETIVYTLALLAVAMAAFQSIFLPQLPIILTFEAVLMLAALATVGTNRWRRWHSKWIDYRFLAERFRSALFMALAKIDVTTLRPPRHLSLAYSPKEWIVPAFISFWSRRPQLEASISVFSNLKHFVCEAWIDDQINYHDSTRKRHYERYHGMTVASYVLFGLTICTVLLYVADVGPHLLSNFFALMAAVLPASAASISAIRTHRDYLRNSMRSAEMVRHLEELKAKMVLSNDYNIFLESLKEAEETMLHEHEDWRVVVRFHTTEIPV